MKLISCNSNRPLAEKISTYLDIPLTNAEVKNFKDREVFVKVNENVRGKDVYIIQSTSAPANDHLMELLIMTDALVRASARRITAVVPYFGYARQDRKTDGRTPISAKLVANLITVAGINRVVTVDLHSAPIQGFFDCPTDNLFAQPEMVDDILKKYGNKDLMVISPDVGGVVRARALAKRLDDVDLAIIDKRRPRPNESKVMNIIGEVKGRTCVLIDDMVDTAGTLCLAAQALKDEGAIKVVAYITHPLLSGKAVERISVSALDELVVTDTIPLSPEAKACGRIRQLSVAGLLGETIRRIRDEESVSSLYVD